MYQERFGFREMTLQGKVIEEVIQTNVGIFFRKNNNRPIRLIDFYKYQGGKGGAQI